jgi:hypothetical protein
MYYATRFINGTLDTSFIRHELTVAERVFINERLEKFLNELHTILFLRPNEQCKYDT